MAEKRPAAEEAGAAAKVARAGGGGPARIAVVGAGWWSQGAHLPQLHANPLAKVAAIVERAAAPRSTLKPDMKTTKELSETYGAPVFQSAEELLASEAGRNLDGIIIASSHASHYEVGMKAIAAGLHVLMEKPMTTDPSQAHELVKAAASSDKFFMVNNSANFREPAQRARGLVRAGEIGEVRHVSCSMASALLWLFDDPKNEGWVKPSGDMLGNGFGWGQLSHTLAWVYMVTGLTPATVFCTMGYSEKTGADLYDAAVVRCTSGATINVQGVATLPFKSYEETSKLIENKIFGTEGVLLYSGDDGDSSSGDMIVRRHDGRHQTFPGFLFENYAMGGEGPESLQAFIRACRGEAVFNGADATVGLKAVQTIEAMYRSAKSGNPEKVA
mmetsp:Transcript_54565/g.165233  ORF Transcript_54565/g.165233 Transcript_54565/m.165233 type:complete len:387 (+) Transcript_54565:55-1215(+)